MKTTLTCLALLLSAAIANAEDGYYDLLESKLKDKDANSRRVELDVEGEAFVFRNSPGWSRKRIIEAKFLENGKLTDETYIPYNANSCTFFRY